MSTPTGTTLRQIWWVPLVCFGLAWALNYTEVIKQLERHTLDWRTRARTHYQKPPDPRLAVVLFEDDTEALLSQPWPVDRQYHAQMTQVLALAGAKMVAWDVIMDVSREGDGDGAFAQIAQAANEAGTTVISAAVTNSEPTDSSPGREGPTKALKQVVGDSSRVKGDKYAFIPYPLLRAVSLYGFADMPPGPDGIRRNIPLVVRVGNELYPTLSLQTLLGYYGVRPDDVRVELGRAITFKALGRTVRLPIDDQGDFLLNYRFDQTGRASDIPVYSYGAILVALSEVHLENKTPENPPPDLKDKIVFIGQTVTGKADAGPSPLRDLTPLTFFVANMVNNVLADDFAWQMPDWIVWLVAVCFTLGGIFLGVRRSVWFMGLITFTGLAGYTALCFWGWMAASWWLPWIWPEIGFVSLQSYLIGRRVLEEQRAKQEIKGMFGSYVSPQLVERLIESGQRPKLGGHEEEITAYFSDIQGFSTFSEKLPPNRLVELMNEYLTACTDIVQEEGGTLDKYIGDAVVAMFGAPIALPDHSYRACVATQRVQRKLAELRAKWQSEGDQWPEAVRHMQSRIGLNSGRCIIGNMGSRTRFNYTMMGDDVNLAARMESGAKSWGVYTMCTEATKHACEQHGRDRLVFRPLGRIVVKGRTQAVPIHEIVGLKENLAPTVPECLGLFSRGLDCYYARDWDGAIALFGQSARLEPNIPGRTPGVVSNPSLVYMEIV
ncbi:MAG: adenylate/guanylate cyclase domain-containing protein, partial [Opitutaceae bacterium]|nr:adenylate/guanylate cyclase domain-containing protein [Opitutaceae bacterium]